MAILEREIEQYFKRNLERQVPGSMCLKFVSPGCSGVPDRLVLLPNGVAVFAELKAPGKVERARQRYVQKQLRDKGFTVFSAVDSKQKADEVIIECRRLCHGV